MSRIRTVKPEFWKHEELSALPESVHMLAASLLNYADDEGYFNANDKLVKAECCPLREPSVSIHDALTMLSNVGYLRLGRTPDGKRYGHVINFELHQRVNRKTESKIKKMEIVWEASVITQPQLTEDSHPEGKGKEGKGTEEDTASAVPSIVFESGIIRLNASDLEKWKRAYCNLDVEAELLGLTEWAGQQPKWFFAVSGALAKRNREVGIRRLAAQSHVPTLPDGSPYPEGII